MEIIIATALAMFVYVFLKAFQQRNVVGLHYAPILPISWFMAAAEIYLIAVVVRVGFDPLLVFAVGTGSGLGAMVAMAVHSRIFRRTKL